MKVAHVSFKFITEKGELRIKLQAEKSKDIVKNDSFMLLKGTTNTKQQSTSSQTIPEFEIIGNNKREKQSLL